MATKDTSAITPMICSVSHDISGYGAVFHG